MSGYRAEVHQLESLTFYFLNHDRQNLLLSLLLFRQEYQSRAIFPFFGDRNALQQNELVRNLQHDACSVAILSNLSATMPHVLQYP